MLSASPFLYWWRVLRFAVFGQQPKTAAELPIWAICVPLRLWHKPVRADGRTFEDLHAGNMAGRRILPLRAFYLLFLFLWPLAALSQALRRFSWLYWKMTMSRPELALQHPKASYTRDEIVLSRPDYTIGMFYAYWFNKERAAFFSLDDKRVFVSACQKAGLPIPRTFASREAAVATGKDIIVKEATSDLGYGVTILTSEELAEEEDTLERFVLQERLYNHPALLAAFPPTAPLSSFRVMTMLDPTTGEPRVVRTAVRIGRAGSAVDNTQQGGIWSRVDMRTGAIQSGVTRHDFGLYDNGKPIRHGEHPDTGKSFVGIRVPWWEEGKALALKAHATLAPGAITLGWDVALCEGAPVLLEVNVWTVLYDYDPDSDIFTPACELMLRELGRLS